MENGKIHTEQQTTATTSLMTIIFKMVYEKHLEVMLMHIGI